MSDQVLDEEQTTGEGYRPDSTHAGDSMRLMHQVPPRISTTTRNLRAAMTRCDEAAAELVAAFRRGEVPERG